MLRFMNSMCKGNKKNHRDDGTHKRTEDIVAVLWIVSSILNYFLISQKTCSKFYHDPSFHHLTTQLAMILGFGQTRSALPETLMRRAL